MITHVLLFSWFSFQCSQWVRADAILNTSEQISKQERWGKKAEKVVHCSNELKKCQIQTAKLFRMKLYHLKTILKTRSQWNDHQDTVSWLKPFDDGPRLYEKPRASLRLSCPWLPGFNAPPRRGSRGLARAISWPVPTERSDSSVRPSTSWSSTQHTFMTCTHWELRLQCQSFHLLLFYTKHDFMAWPASATDSGHLTLWRPLFPYGYSYKASCARLG